MRARPYPSLSLFAGLFAIGGVILTIAALILTRIAWKMTGAADVFVAPDPALLQTMGGVWGLFLAANIVKLVAASSFTLTFWLTAAALPLRGRLAALAVVLAGTGGMLLLLAFRMGIRASAWLSHGVAPHGGDVAQQLVAAGMVCGGLSVALLGVEGARGRLFPGWMPALGPVLALLGLAQLVHPLAVLGFALLLMLWWVMLLPPLFGGTPRVA